MVSKLQNPLDPLSFPDTTTPLTFCHPQSRPFIDLLAEIFAVNIKNCLDSTAESKIKKFEILNYPDSKLIAYGLLNEPEEKKQYPALRLRPFLDALDILGGQITHKHFLAVEAWLSWPSHPDFEEIEDIVDTKSAYEDRNEYKGFYGEKYLAAKTIEIFASRFPEHQFRLELRDTKTLGHEEGAFTKFHPYAARLKAVRK